MMLLLVVVLIVVVVLVVYLPVLRVWSRVSQWYPPSSAEARARSHPTVRTMGSDAVNIGM